jgi:Lrp/AsnC family leucine-responsive transcriptional regulator
MFVMLFGSLSYGVALSAHILKSYLILLRQHAIIVSLELKIRKMEFRVTLLSLDRIDCQILEILQVDNQISNLMLAEKIGLSAPACSRRVARLHEKGIIVRNVSIVDPQKVGKVVKVVIAVTLAVRQKESIEEFQYKVRQRSEVLQCYMIAGSIDFFVVAVLDDVASYAEFAAEIFAGDDNVKSYESWFVLLHVKNETKLPLTSQH